MTPRRPYYYVDTVFVQHTSAYIRCLEFIPIEKGGVGWGEGTLLPPPGLRLKLGLVKRHAAAEAARGQLAVCRGELGGEHHVAVRVDGAHLPQAAGLDGHAVHQLAAVLVEGEQADAVAVRRADEPSVGAEAQLLDVAPAHVGLLDVVGEAEGAAGGDRRAGGRALLEFVHARPLQGDVLLWYLYLNSGTTKKNIYTYYIYFCCCVTFSNR